MFQFLQVSPSLFLQAVVAGFQSLYVVIYDQVIQSDLAAIGICLLIAFNLAKQMVRAVWYFIKIAAYIPTRLLLAIIVRLLVR